MMSAGQEQTTKAAAAETKEAQSPLDAIIDLMPTRIKKERDKATDFVRTVVEEATKGTFTWDKTLTRTLTQAQKQLDAVLSKQLAAIMHNPQFQKLEGSWRGLKYLVFNSETGEQLKLKVLNVSKRQLFKDLENAIEFDQSTMFKHIYESEFGMPGGVPYGALVGDYEFTPHPEDISLLEKMSQVAAAAFCPFISAADPGLLDLQSFAGLPKPRDLAKTFEQEDWIKWRAFRDSEDSRFVALTLPRVLSRLPYGASTKPIDEFAYEEVELDAKGRAKPVPHEHYAWMSSAYVYGARLTDAFAKTGWCTAIRGAENGGKVEGLPIHVFKSDDGDLDVKCPTEVAITDRREHELSKLGFLPLCYYKNQDCSVFFGGQTTQKPKKYDTAQATENAAISARLPVIMATGRICHYLKVMARDWVGSFKEREDLEKALNRWIARYIAAAKVPSEEEKAKYPLAAAKITVKEIPGAPGYYNAVAHLRPWLQLEALTTSLRMVTKIPGSK